MNKNNFPYFNPNLKLSRDHKYQLNGKTFESVTSWLGRIMGKDFNPYEISEKVSKNQNSEYFGMDPKKIRDLWSKTSVRGNKKHKEVEDWLNGKIENFENSKYLESINISPNNCWAELKVYSEKYMLAGTIDILKTFEKDGMKIYQPWDIKTFKKVDKEKIESASMQIFIYCKLLRDLIKDKDVIIKPGKIILISPEDNVSDGVSYKFKEPEILDIDKNVIKNLSKLLEKKREV